MKRAILSLALLALIVPATDKAPYIDGTRPYYKRMVAGQPARNILRFFFGAPIPAEPAK